MTQNMNTVEKEPKSPSCNQKMEVFSRVVGYYRPVENWNKGKQDEFKARRTFTVSQCTRPLTEKKEA